MSKKFLQILIFTMSSSSVFMSPTLGYNCNEALELCKRCCEGQSSECPLGCHKIHENCQGRRSANPCSLGGIPSASDDARLCWRQGAGCRGLIKR